MEPANTLEGKIGQNWKAILRIQGKVKYSLLADALSREQFQFEKKLMYGDNPNTTENPEGLTHLFNLKPGDYVVKVLPLKIGDQIDVQFMRIIYQIISISEVEHSVRAEQKLILRPQETLQSPSIIVSIPLIYGEFWMKVEDLTEPHGSNIMEHLQEKD